MKLNKVAKLESEIFLDNYLVILVEKLKHVAKKAAKQLTLVFLIK